jgi:hypothetical protein
MRVCTCCLEADTEWTCLKHKMPQKYVIISSKFRYNFRISSSIKRHSTLPKRKVENMFLIKLKTIVVRLRIVSEKKLYLFFRARK